MISTNDGLKLGIFNTRGLKAKLEVVDQMAHQFAVLGLCETWLREKDEEVLKSLDCSALAPPTLNLARGHGGVGIIINSLLQYDIVYKTSTQTIQCVTAKVNSVMITVLYISPQARPGDVSTILDKIKHLSGNQAVIMGDLNGRHTSWDAVSNARGRRLYQWALKHGWKIIGPDLPSLITPRGKSSPDIFLVKGVRTSKAKTWTHMTSSGSDHLPVHVHIYLHQTEPPQRQSRCIPRRQRTNPRIVEKARASYIANMTPCLQRIESAETVHELEAAYRKYKDTLLAPWESTRRAKPGRFKGFWNNTLDTMAKRRRKLYRRALTTGAEQDKEAHRKLDKQIKSYVKKNKRNQQERLTKLLANGTQKWAPRDINTALKRTETGDDEQPSALDPDRFTAHMETPRPIRWAPSIMSLAIDETWRIRVEAAIKKAPRNKASGTDEVFSEALNVDSRTSSEILCALWKKCVQVGHILEDWSTALLVPLFKKGDHTEPGSYRPIALLSHARKAIEAAIAMAIRKDYRFSDCQLGFRIGTGTETAIVRHIANAEKMGITAVLDLKSAYDSVPRDKLIATVKSRTNPTILAAVQSMLQPVRIKTQGTTTQKTGIIARGVCQGSPLSPMLFNIYMDTLADTLRGRKRLQPMGTTCTSSRDIGLSRRWDLTMFADDVKVQAETEVVLQPLLNTLATWAKEHGMTWNVNKCHIVGTGNPTPRAPLKLAGSEVGTANKAEYLGVSIDARGTLADTNIRRIESAIKMSYALGRAGIQCGKVITATMLEIWETLILPKATYAVHLVPKTEQMVKKWDELEKTMLVSTTGCYSSRHKARLLQIVKWPTLQQRREVAMTALQKRIQRYRTAAKEEGEAKRDTERVHKARRVLQNMGSLQRVDVLQKWVRDDQHRKRKLPTSQTYRKPPALSLKSHKLRRSAVHWYCGSFPILPGRREGAAGVGKSMMIMKLEKLMRLPKWKGCEEREVRNALRQLSEWSMELWNR